MDPLLALLGALALAWPLVLALALYDLRWALLARKAGQWPPFGVWARLAGMLLGHGGAALIVARHGAWPPEVLKFWIHMALDPALCCYAYGLYDLQAQLQRRQGQASTVAPPPENSTP